MSAIWSLIPLPFLTNLIIWNFMVHVLLKPGLENFKHYFTSMSDDCNCVVVWAFVGISFPWDWNENRPCPVPRPLLSFPNLLAYWVQHFHSVIFWIWNSLPGIPSPLLALSIVMLSKAHLTSHSRMSDSRWVITPSWLSGSWRSFLYSSSVYSCYAFLTSSTSVKCIPFLSFIEPIFAGNVLISFFTCSCPFSQNQSAALNMPASLENSAVATGLEKVSFHSYPKEMQCWRMLKLPHNCTHLTC